MRHKAPLKQYWLEIGVHFIKKGSNHFVGEITSKKQIGQDKLYIHYVGGITYDFATNKIIPKYLKKVAKTSDIVKVEKGR